MVHWKMLMRNWVLNNKITNSILQVNGLDVFVAGDVTQIVNNPIRPGTFFGMPCVRGGRIHIRWCNVVCSFCALEPS